MSQVVIIVASILVATGLVVGASIGATDFGAYLQSGPACFALATAAGVMALLVSLGVRRRRREPRP